MNSRLALWHGLWYRCCSRVAIDDGTCSCGVRSPSGLDQFFALSPGAFMGAAWAAGILTLGARAVVRSSVRVDRSNHGRVRRLSGSRRTGSSLEMLQILRFLSLKTWLRSD
jgi:hypothetical protein